MIVGYQPGGTIADARVVLRPDELLPNDYNTVHSAVYREDPDNPREWVLVKPKGEVLPADSPLLSVPGVVPVDILDMGTEPEEAPFEHRDIIHFEE